VRFTKTLITLTACLALATALAAENPVAFVMEMSGTWQVSDANGASRALKIGDTLCNGQSVKRDSKEGHIITIDASGQPSAALRADKYSFANLPTISAARQKVYASYIGGTMGGRRGKGADDHFDWTMPMGAIKSSDIKSGAMALVFTEGPSSEDTRGYLPLRWRLKPGIDIKSISYRVIFNTLIMAEGDMRRVGADWVLPLKQLGLEDQSSVKISLSVKCVEKASGKDTSFEMDVPYSVIKNEAFIEEEIDLLIADLTEGGLRAITPLLRDMARVAVYEDYNMTLYVRVMAAQVGR
jgi:hypothetical protein